MSYPIANHLNEKLREVLFLMLARQNDYLISQHKGCGERSVTDCKKEIFEKLCGTGAVDFVLIFHKAKGNPGLCRSLADEFRTKYPALVSIVEKEYCLTVQYAIVDGKKETYVWP